MHGPRTWRAIPESRSCEYYGTTDMARLTGATDMVRLRTSFATYVTLCVVAVHIVLLPALFFGMGYVIRKSHEDLFVEHARTFARVLAEEFEAGVALDSRERTEDLLDLA